MTLEELLRLQDVDRKLNRLMRESKDIPARISDSQTRLESHRLGLQVASDELKKIAVEIKEREGEIEVRRQRVTKYKTQQMQVKNNDEYRALIREVHSEEKAIRDIEDGELDMMEKMETLKGQVAVRQAALEEEELLVSADEEALASRAAEIEQELQSVQALRTSMASEFDPIWMSRYNRILANKGDMALVPIENTNICGGCHMQVPPQTVHNARAGNSMTTCDYCGRLVYWPHG